MVPVLQALPIDWSSKSANNRTKGELHDLSPQFDCPYRIVVMEKGYFYTNDLFIMDNRGYVLTEGLDYQCTLVSSEVADKTGLTACAVIMVSNPRVGNYLRIDAQMVGGRFCSLNRAILAQALNVIGGTNRKIYWKNIKDKPSGYRPNGHLHALWELYGFTEQVDILKRMSTALDKKLEKEFNAVFDEYMNFLDQIKDGLTDVEDRLTTHINDRSDPHDVTALQVKLEMVVNARPATEDQALAASGTILNAYATPLRARQSIATNFLPSLQNHIADINNPHQDTAAKLGTITNMELVQLANRYYNKGETTALTARIGGYDLLGYYNRTRTNVPIGNIVTGLLPQQTWTGEAGAGGGSLLGPLASGYYGWADIPSLFNIYEKKGNLVIYTSLNIEWPISANPEPLVNQRLQVLNSAVGAYPEGSICVFKWNANWVTSTGNGTVTTNVANVGMCVRQGGIWKIPGFPGP